MIFYFHIELFLIFIFIFFGIAHIECLINNADMIKSTAAALNLNNTIKLDYKTEHYDFVSEYNLEKIKVSMNDLNYLLILNLSYLEKEVESGSKKHEIFITKHDKGALIQVELHTIPKATIYITMKNLDRPKYINVFFYNDCEKIRCYEIKDTKIEEYKAVLNIPDNTLKKIVFANSENLNEFCSCSLIDGYSICLEKCYGQEIYCETCDKYKIKTICKRMQSDYL